MSASDITSEHCSLSIQGLLMAIFTVSISFNLDGAVEFQKFTASSYDEVLIEIRKIWNLLKTSDYINTSNEYFLSASVDIDSDIYDFYFGSFNFENDLLEIFADFDDGLIEESWSDNGFDTSQSFSSRSHMQNALFDYLFEFEKNNS